MCCNLQTTRRSIVFSGLAQEGETHVYATIINHGNSVYCFKRVGDNSCQLDLTLDALGSITVKLL